MKWLPLDLALVSGFAVIGRMSHDEPVTGSGWWNTAWPFLVGVLIGWAVIGLTHRPASSAAAGVIIWACTVIGGLLLRRLTDQGTATPFLVVATLVLGLLLIGPRTAVRQLQHTPTIG